MNWSHTVSFLFRNRLCSAFRSFFHSLRNPTQVYISVHCMQFENNFRNSTGLNWPWTSVIAEVSVESTDLSDVKS